MARGRWPVLLLLAAAGCGPSPSQKGTAAGEEAQVKEAFAAYQQAIESKDADKLWELLDPDARAAADRAAKRLKDDYAKADADAKAKQAKDLGLSGDELANLTGKLYLKTPRFLGKPQNEVPTSKYDSATIQGDKATVKYKEADGDDMTLTFVRAGGHWKVSPAIK
jgi:hypothetical protein